MVLFEFLSKQKETSGTGLESLSEEEREEDPVPIEGHEIPAEFNVQNLKDLKNRNSKACL